MTTTTPKKRRGIDWKPLFLEAFESCGTVADACRAVGIARQTVYRARQQDEAFALAWADIEEQTTERMEREAYRRAVEGVERDVYHQGKVVGRERNFSDVLLIFMLKSRRPAVYRDNVKVEHAGEVSGTGPQLVVDAKLAEEARALLRRAASVGGDQPGGAGAGDQ